MQKVFNEYPALYGTDDILYHIGRNLEIIANKETPNTTPYNIIDNKNYGNSLILNGALELDDVTNINNAIVSNVKFNGFKTFLLDGVKNPYFSSVIIRKERLIRASAFIKTDITSSVKFHLRAYDINNNLAQKNGNDPWSSSIPLASNGVFSYKEAYFGGIGTGMEFFHPDTHHVQLNIYGYNGNSYLSNLILKEVSLSEPVPYTLPYLPTGQIIFDPATNAVGRYNGTTINWFM